MIKLLCHTCIVLVCNSQRELGRYFKIPRYRYTDSVLMCSNVESVNWAAWLVDIKHWIFTKFVFPLQIGLRYRFCKYFRDS
jgi:hypothetical protein